MNFIYNNGIDFGHNNVKLDGNNFAIGDTIFDTNILKISDIFKHPVPGNHGKILLYDIEKNKINTSTNYTTGGVYRTPCFLGSGADSREDSGAKHNLCLGKNLILGAKDSLVVGGERVKIPDQGFDFEGEMYSTKVKSTQMPLVLVSVIGGEQPYIPNPTLENGEWVIKLFWKKKFKGRIYLKVIKSPKIYRESQ